MVMYVVGIEVILLHTCNFLQPSHDEQISLMLGNACHVLSDDTCLTDHFYLDPVGNRETITFS